MGNLFYHRRQWLGDGCTEGLCVETLVPLEDRDGSEQSCRRDLGAGRGWQMSSGKYQRGGLSERTWCWSQDRQGGRGARRSGKLLVDRSSGRRRGIITALRLASPAAVTAWEGSTVSCCCRHSEGTVSACRYSFPIGASKATDSCGTRVERDGRSHEELGSGKATRGLSGRETPMSFRCSYTISCQGRASWPFSSAATQKCHLACSWRSLWRPNTIALGSVKGLGVSLSGGEFRWPHNMRKS